MLAVAAMTWCLGFAGAPGADDALPGGRRALPLEWQGEWIGNGVAFSPYRDGQKPDGASPSEAEILSDLRLVARYWHFIRVYDASEVSETAVRLIERERLPIRVILGAWLVDDVKPADRKKNREQVANAIRIANAYPGTVAAVCAGNEAGVVWSDHRTSPEKLVGWLNQIRSSIRQPVTCADDYNFWNKEASKPVAAAVDFIMLHAYALWNGKPLESAMQWTAGKYDACCQFHPGVPVVIGETGWATSHDPKRVGEGAEGTAMRAEVSVAAQEIYLRQHFRWVNERKVPTFLFEAFDEAWKGGGDEMPATIAEKHWGVFDAQRRPKASFEAVAKEFFPSQRP